MKKLILPLLMPTASPAFASGGPFLSLHNTNFVVMISFLVFVAILLWAKVPAKIGAMLDARADQIKAELAEAKALREEARALLSSYEKKQKEVQEQSARIVAHAKEEAEAAAAQAKADLKVTIARRLAAADDQLASAQSSAIRQVREQAIAVAVSVAGEVLAKQANATSQAASIDAAIAQVEAKLH